MLLTQSKDHFSLFEQMLNELKIRLGGYEDTQNLNHLTIPDPNTLRDT